MRVREVVKGDQNNADRNPTKTINKLKYSSVLYIFDHFFTTLIALLH